MRTTQRTLFLLLATLSLLLLSAPAMAERQGRGPGTLGFGLGAGTLTQLGLSAKYFIGGGDTAVQGNLGCGGWSCESVGLSADYLFEFPALAKGRGLDVAFAAGFGGGLGIHSHPALAAAGVLGLEFNLNVIPLDIVAEWRPRLLVVPDTRLDLIEVTGQVRFYVY